MLGGAQLPTSAGGTVTSLPATACKRCKKRDATVVAAVKEVQENPYAFISEQAMNASAKYGVKSISLLAVAPHE